jgi:hypothetical protein
MDHLRRLGNKFSIPIEPDADRFIGLECPDDECGKYFKIEYGTGLDGEDLLCHCPYCGMTAPDQEFRTTEQIEFAKSHMLRQVTDAVVKDMKKLEFNHRPTGAFGFGVSMKVKLDKPIRIEHYQEKTLETIVVCDSCTLRYAIYGVFGFCPDCGQRNSNQILEKNLDVVGKQLALAEGVDDDLSEKLKEDALENVVSAFDGFGREVCRVHAHEASNPTKAKKISFQNLVEAERRLFKLFAFGLTDCLESDDWQFVKRCFQKRHLFEHKVGVIDADYITKTNDPDAVLGHKVVVTVDEILKLVGLVRQLGQSIHSHFSGGSGR